MRTCVGIIVVCLAWHCLEGVKAFSTFDRAHRTLLHFRDREVYEERVAVVAAPIATPDPPAATVQERKHQEPQPWQSIVTSKLMLVSLASVVPPIVFGMPSWWEGLGVDMNTMAWMLPLGVVVGAIPLILRPLPHQHRFRIQDSCIRTYGTSNDEVHHHPMGWVTATSVLADEVIYRFYLYHLIESVTGSSLLALIAQAAIYAPLGDTESMLEGLWYGILTVNTGGILPAFVAHTCVDWHRQAVIHCDAMQQMEYIQSNKSDAATSGHDAVRRFCYAFDSRHAGELSRHDMDRALAYARLPLPEQRLPSHCTYEEFESLLKQQHKAMRNREKEEDA